MIGGDIGTGASFAKAIVAFAERYADETGHDDAALLEAIQDGVVPAERGM
jgi:hypothetical protein